MIPPAGVVLAAGAGSRLRPLTELRPKPLCPVGGTTLLDHALGRLRPHVSGLAVNLHHGADLIDRALPRSVHRSHERGEALGTAGALGRLRPWTGDRDVLVTNADAWFASPPDLDRFVSTWDRRSCRLLCVETGVPADFGTLRYCGVALLPSSAVADLPAEPAGLYEVLWESAADRGDLDLVVHPGTVVDCGTPSDYLRANMLATGGRSVTDGATIHPGAHLTRCVVWPGSTVWLDERLRDAVRAADLTVLVR